MIFNRLIDKKLRTDNISSQVDGESIKRSLVKTISWRIVGTIDTVMISWLITGTLTFALSIGALELFTKMILYFFHERIWSSINYG